MREWGETVGEKCSPKVDNHYCQSQEVVVSIFMTSMIGDGFVEIIDRLV